MMAKMMKSMKKKVVLAFGMVMVFACQPMLHVSASGTDGAAGVMVAEDETDVMSVGVVAGTEETVRTIASSDMTVGGTQTFELTDAAGGEVIVTVSELPSISRVADGTYQISYTSPGKWEVAYKIKVSNDRITSVYDGYHKALTGSISSGKLRIDSATQASYTFEYKGILLTSKRGMRSVLNGSKIDISGI